MFIFKDMMIFSSEFPRRTGASYMTFKNKSSSYDVSWV